MELKIYNLQVLAFCCMDFLVSILESVPAIPSLSNTWRKPDIY